MAETEYVRRSVKDISAGLNLGEVGRAPVTAKPAKLTVKPKVVRSSSADVPQSGTDGVEIPNQPAGEDAKDAPVPRLPPRRPTDKAEERASVPTPPSRRATERIAGKPAPPSVPPRRAGNAPALPTRAPSEASSVSTVASASDALVPPLPSRRPSNSPGLPGRRESQTSVTSASSAVSSVSRLSSGSTRPSTIGTPTRGEPQAQPRVRAPVFDPSTLPPLPPKRSEKKEEKGDAPPRLPVRGKSSSSLRSTARNESPPPPALPTRRVESNTPGPPSRKLPPRDMPPPLPAVQRPSQQSNGAPPPIPMSTRPDLSKIMSTKPKFTPSSVSSTAAPTTGSACLQCRDFSGPDDHASKFPRQNVTSLDTLAYELTAPFTSPTDKARAIFTWMHHNVAYDCASFFGGCVKPVTPLDVLQSGLAVCAGYAGLYADLALKAGLECIVVGGHGKGFGFSALQPGQPIPPESQGHAWNAVKIDVGGPGGPGQMYWKLIDACWGAGHLGGDQKYNAAFNHRMFSDSNEDFGRKHFPQDKSKFFRADGRQLTWAEYFVGEAGGEPVQVYSNVAPREGISESKFLPAQKRISLDPTAHAGTNGMIRFQFQRVCEHWKPEVNGQGKDFCYVLACTGSEWVPFETNGLYWWCDVHVSQLGKSGETLNIWVADSVCGKTGRGLTPQAWKVQKGMGGIGYSGLGCYQLV